MDSLVDDVLGVLAQELQDVLHLGLVGQSPQPDAVLPRPGSDELLGYHSHGRQAGRQAGDQGGAAPSSSSSSDEAGLASPGLCGSVEDLRTKHCQTPPGTRPALTPPVALLPWWT